MRRPGPPADVDPAELFASISAPLPIVPIAQRLSVAPDRPLFVRALQGNRILNAWRAGRHHDYMADALVDREGRPLLAEPDALLLLRMSEFRSLREAIWQAFGRIGPTFQFSDVAAWHARLAMGMPANGSLTNRMMTCFDYAIGAHQLAIVDRPDRYYGVPAHQLLDGHVMVFSVLRDWEQQRAKRSRR